MSFFAALQFLTIIPLPWRREVSPAELGHSTAYFPLVGLIIGLILLGWRWLLGLFLPPEVANVLVIATLVLFSGALHLDGLLDTFDGIAGHGSVEERWRAMRDSRAGGIGVIAVCCLLLVKFVSLNSIPDAVLGKALVLMPVVSRWAMAYAIFAYPYARPDGLGKAFKEATRWLRFTVATVVTFVVAVFLFPLPGLTFPLSALLLLMASWILVVTMAAYLRSKFAGLTGDTYGAINEVIEVSVLIIILVLDRLGLS
ncbi:adenosylcobinamide-GDP ribazoletransferase [Chloroflexota bacterium]